MRLISRPLVQIISGKESQVLSQILPDLEEICQEPTERVLGFSKRGVENSLYYKIEANARKYFADVAVIVNDDEKEGRIIYSNSYKVAYFRKVI